MLPSKMRPTTSAFLLMTGLPEFPPMMSAVQTKFIGVLRSSLDLRLIHGSGMSKGGLFVDVNEIEYEAVDVAVENEADDLGVFVDDRAAGIPANDVSGANKIHRRAEVEFGFALDPRFRNVEGRLVVVFGAAFR